MYTSFLVGAGTSSTLGSGRTLVLGTACTTSLAGIFGTVLDSAARSVESFFGGVCNKQQKLSIQMGPDVKEVEHQRLTKLPWPHRYKTSVQNSSACCYPFYCSLEYLHARNYHYGVITLSQNKTDKQKSPMTSGKETRCSVNTSAYYYESQNYPSHYHCHYRSSSRSVWSHHNSTNHVCMFACVKIIK